MAIALALALAQVLLPGIAADRIGSRVRRYGSVQSVSVTAWPAVKLLWGRADSVKLKARELRLSPQQAAKLVWEGRGVGSIDMTANDVRIGPLRVSDVAMRKRGSILSAHALTSAWAPALAPSSMLIQPAAPFGISIGTVYGEMRCQPLSLSLS